MRDHVSLSRRAAAWICGVAGMILYNWWILVPLKPGLMPAVLDSFNRVSAGADIVLVEWAGSASEVNLRAGDIANMGFARAGNVPVVLVGDIERGGVIASLVGTKAVLPAEDAAMIVAFLVIRTWVVPAIMALYVVWSRTIGRRFALAPLSTAWTPAML